MKSPVNSSDAVSKRKVGAAHAQAMKFKPAIASPTNISHVPLSSRMCSARRPRCFYALGSGWDCCDYNAPDYSHPSLFLCSLDRAGDCDELLGNQVPHIHWHLVPRLSTDPDPHAPIWRVAHEPAPLAPAAARDRIEAIRRALAMSV